MSTTSLTSASRPSKTLHIVMWVLQVILAGVFAMSGFMKLITPIETMSAQMAWAEDMPLLVRFIGLAEVAGAIGLIVPALTRIKPQLVVWAAYGLALIMILALIYHMSRGEYSTLPVNLGFFAVALFIAWGRSKKVPISPRNALRTGI